MSVFSKAHLHEMKTAALFGAVGSLGFVTDYAVLRIALHFGLPPAFGRIISLLCAMQVTFTVNGLFVFRCLTWAKLPRQWIAYMATNGFGNFCNYWIFVTLVSLHAPLFSDHLFAIAVGSATAWGINYIGTRFFAFGKAARQDLAQSSPGSTMPVSDDTPTKPEAA